MLPPPLAPGRRPLDRSGALRRGVGGATGLLLTVLGAAASAEPSSAPAALTFEDSAARLSQRSDRLAEADAGVRAADARAEALKGLRHPIVSLDAQVLEYQKSLELSVAGLKTQGEASASAALSGLNSSGVSGVPPASVQAVTSQVQAALPGVFSAIPDTLSVRDRQTLVHPTVSALLPIYSGGAIPAIQRAAAAAVALAKAKQASAEDVLQLQLVQAYFGQVLAARAQQVARDTRDGFDRHLDDARKLEAAGQLSHARVLEVEVARDAAQRALDKADGERRTTQDVLANLVHSETAVEPTTNLFVASTPLGPVGPFIDAAEADHPQLRQAKAAVDAARQGVKLVHADQLPSVYAFGEYNLNRRNELAPEPDWIVGIGVHYTLFSNINRRKAESAARLTQSAAEAAERQARVDLRTNIEQAYTLTETARRQFLTLDSSLAAAREGLRVHEAAFREGEASATEVIDARNALSLVRTQRAAAAYEYDLALATLLLASGQTARFVDYLKSADRRVLEP